MNNLDEGRVYICLMHLDSSIEHAIGPLAGGFDRSICHCTVSFETAADTFSYDLPICGSLFLLLQLVSREQWNVCAHMIRLPSEAV